MSETCCIEVEVPKPIVKRPRILKLKGVDVGVRVGRGFSIGEIKAAGINITLAKQLNIPIDTRRKSVHEENVENLKKFLEQVAEIVNAIKTKPAKNIPPSSSQ